MAYQGGLDGSVDVAVSNLSSGPLLVDPDQLWFWTPEWQQGEREADADIKEGRTEHFSSAEDFLASLAQLDRAPFL